MEKRRVEFFRRKFVRPGVYDKVEVKQGTFHCWGVDYEEFEEGPGNFSTAIIELDDGAVVNHPAGDIKFLDKGEKDNE